MKSDSFRIWWFLTKAFTSSSLQQKTNSRLFLDKKIQQTVYVVIEEFFKNEGAVLDYICATEDHRQASRDRMFQLWYANSLEKEHYFLRKMSVEIDGTEYFSSVIMKNDNPRFNAMNEAIDRFIQDFQDKLK